MLGTAAVMVLMLSSGAAAMVITTPHFRCVDISRYISTIYLHYIYNYIYRSPSTCVGSLVVSTVTGDTVVVRGEGRHPTTNIRHRGQLTRWAEKYL